MLRHLLPGMRRNGWGRIVNVTSAAGIRGTAGYPAYAASKGALVAFSLTLALELAGTGVCVNAFAPVALTDMVRSQVTPRTLEYLVDRGCPPSTNAPRSCCHSSSTTPRPAGWC